MPILKTSSGAAIGWDEFGDKSRPPLVLIQGLGAQRLGWRPGFCERLAAEGFRVVRFDNRDVGQSQRYPDGGYAISDFADDTAALLDRLSLASAHIVGQSMGGIIAQDFALRYPARVRSLGLLYTAASIRHFRGRDAVEERMSVPAPSTRDEFIAYYPASEAACASAGYPQDVTWLAEVAGQIWDAGWEPDGAERQLAAVLDLGDRTEAARTIRASTAIIAGDSDQLIDPAASEELHDVIPGSTLTIFPGMGHEVPQPLWEEISTLIGANACGADALE